MQRANADYHRHVEILYPKDEQRKKTEQGNHAIQISDRIATLDISKSKIFHRYLEKHVGMPPSAHDIAPFIAMMFRVTSSKTMRQERGEKEGRRKKKQKLSNRFFLFSRRCRRLERASHFNPTENTASELKAAEIVVVKN